MRKYSAPSLEIEAFEVLDVITASSSPVGDVSEEIGGGFGTDSVGDFDFQGEFVF